jgi:hypothetical protein
LENVKKFVRYLITILDFFTFFLQKKLIHLNKHRNVLNPSYKSITMVVEEVFEVNYNGTVIDLFKIVDQCMLYSCVCCVIVVVGIALLVSFTNIVTRI